MNKLNLGSGNDYRKGWVNVDIDPDIKTDWCGDATKMPYPDNHFEEIFSHHSLEHFTCLFTILNELVRVSKNGATWEHTVPYWSWPMNQGNPHHHIYFSEHTMKFFDKVNGVYKRGQKQPYSLEEIDTEWDEREITFRLKINK